MVGVPSHAEPCRPSRRGGVTTERRTFSGIASSIVGEGLDGARPPECAERGPAYVLGGPGDIPRRVTGCRSRPRPAKRPPTGHQVSTSNAGS